MAAPCCLIRLHCELPARLLVAAADEIRRRATEQDIRRLFGAVVCSGHDTRFATVEIGLNPAQRRCGLPPGEMNKRWKDGIREVSKSVRAVRSDCKAAQEATRRSYPH